MGKAKITKKFAAVKRLMNPKDPRIKKNKVKLDMQVEKDKKNKNKNKIEIKEMFLLDLIEKKILHTYFLNTIQHLDPLIEF